MKDFDPEGSFGSGSSFRRLGSDRKNRDPGVQSDDEDDMFKVSQARPATPHLLLMFKEALELLVSLFSFSQKLQAMTWQAQKVVVFASL